MTTVAIVLLFFGYGARLATSQVRAGMRNWRLQGSILVATFVMCGSTKSLATGLPMAAVLLPAATAATVTLPVVVFHQLRLTVCAAIARRLAAGARQAGPRVPG